MPSTKEPYEEESEIGDLAAGLLAWGAFAVAIAVAVVLALAGRHR